MYDEEQVTPVLPPHQEYFPPVEPLPPVEQRLLVQVVLPAHPGTAHSELSKQREGQVPVLHCPMPAVSMTQYRRVPQAVTAHWLEVMQKLGQVPLEVVVHEL